MLSVRTTGKLIIRSRSLINGMKRKKVVSTSRTPGHTKHFQVRIDCEIAKLGTYSILDYIPDGTHLPV